MELATVPVATTALASVTSPPAAAAPGKSAQSVGHLAKSAVAEARAAGLDLPKNAQGFAAAQIAQGADPASVFAALVTPAAPPPDDGADPGFDPNAEPELSLAEMGVITGDFALTDAEVALELLQEA